MNAGDFLQSWVDAHFEAETRFLAAMVQVPSDNPPGRCLPHAEMACRQLRDLGLEPERFDLPADLVQAAGMQSAANLIVRQRFGSLGPCIALNAHGDVVPPGLGWTHDPYGASVVGAHAGAALSADGGAAARGAGAGAVMYGRGVAVSKSDFATYTFALLALRALASQGHELNGGVELHLTYDEETGGELGPRWLLEQGYSKPDYCIGAGFSYAVTTAHNGCLHLEVTVRGRQAHAAMPQSGVDALAGAVAILTALYASRAALDAHRSATPGITHPTLNVGLIKGGINTNVVPDCVSFRIDRRIIPEESPAAVEADMRTLLQDAAAQLPGIRLEIRRIMLALPLRSLAGSERLTQLLRKHGERFLGTPIGEHGVPLYTDARHYAAAGIPTVLYGAGPRTLAEANGHAADECLRLEDLRAATATIACTLADLLTPT